MSLLLDALKRAEQEKLARLAQELQAAESASADPPPRAPAAAPRRNLELERHESAAAPEAAAAPSAAATRREREGAKVVFAAKQADPLPTVREPRGNRTMLAIVGAAVLLVLAGGAYVWYEINATPGSMVGPPRMASAPRPVTPAPPPPPSPVTGTAPATPPAPSIAAAAEAAPAAAKAAPKPAPRPAERVIAGLLKEGAEAPPPRLKLTRTIEAPRVSPDVKRGYEALLRGDADAARRAYEAALAADGASLDAHLGLAAVAARAGERAAAAGHYRRALALDPRNASALAGLAALSDFTRAEGLEAQLRADIGRSPTNAALPFTLGNLYASQSRWNEAQAAYFEAYRLDPGSADLAFNLAVSLDHLGQARLAADYYQRALEAARRQAPQFDRAQVTRRLAELKR